ncbi:MAG: M23 family metallopeptidase [Acidimicrobiia bacterium]
MKLIAGLAAAVLALLLGLAIILGAAIAANTEAPSDEALAEIPPHLLRAYVDAARTCQGLPWEVLAAIGWIESHHAQGRAEPTSGDVRPPIVGPALDGSSGFARIPDPSEPDGWAHAHGNMQFLKSTWTRWGRLAPGRPAGTSPDYDNAYDSIHGAAYYLCGDDGVIEDLNAAILRYNPSQRYLDDVLAKAAAYRRAAAPGLLGGPIVAGAYTLPLDRGIFDAHPEYLTKPHHDYPAADIPIAEGTPVYATTNGQVLSVTPASSRCGNGIVLAADDGYRYVYCHANQLLVGPGQPITVGQTVMFSGNTGNSTGPHLHFGVETAEGAKMCPQPLLDAWYQGVPAAPPTTLSGCFY